MSAFPTFADLARIPFGVLCGLIEEVAGPAHAARYDDPWFRHSAVLGATEQALRDAVGGRVPAVERAIPPRWLADAVRERVSALSTTWSHNGGFAEIRSWERLGLVTLPVDDAYVLAVINGLGRRWGVVDRAAVLRDDPDAWIGPLGHHLSVLDRAALLREDPELRERLWRVFEIEGGGEVSLANVDRWSRGEATWRDVFLELVGDGTLDRGRVLAGCLDALQRDYGTSRAQWFSALYRDLAPTAEEARDDQARYRALLRSGVGSTVSLAARLLRKVSAAGAFDDDECAALAPGLLARTKGAALDVLRVLDDVARRRPDLHPVLATVVGGACEHPHVDVQRAAVAALVRLGIDPLVHADALAPSLRAELGAAEAPPPEVTPVGPPVATLLPVTGADLLDRTAALLEDASDPLEIELVLAGLATLADPDVLAPLRKRAGKMIRAGAPGWGDESWLRGHLARLVLAGGPEPLPVRGSRPAFLARRLDGVADVLAGRRAPGVLLATPDSADGLLDPARLVHRLARVADPRPEDLVAALLRLDRRGSDVVVPGDGEIARVIRHALGAPVPPDGPRGDEALWAAAARTRHPGADDGFLLAAGLSAAGQGRAVRAYGEITPPVVREVRGELRVLRRLRFDLRVHHAADRPDPRQPMLATDKPRYEEEFGEWVGWMLAISPHDLEPALTDLVLPVLHAAHVGGVEHDVTRVLDGLARHPGPLGRLGVTALAAAMTVQRADQRVLAVDTIGAFATTGRVPAVGLAEAMAELVPVAVPTRWAGSLQSLAQAYPGPYVVDLLTALLPTLPADLRGVHALVELVLEESVRTGRRVTEPGLRGWLAALPGRGRGARAAGSLLAR